MTNIHPFPDPNRPFRHQRLPTRVGLTALILALSPMPGQALAETEIRQLEDVRFSVDPLVSPQARTELGQLTPDTPSAGSVIDQEELEKVHFVDSVNELLNRIPGTSLTRNMRIPIGGRSYTGNLIDGQAVSSPQQHGTWGFIEETNTWDIERVEVTRGPASVLNSSNTVGGTINVITRDPPAGPEHRIWAQTGESDLYRGGVSTGDTLENGLGYLLDANLMRDDGWREHARRERDAVSGKLQFDPTETTRVQMRMEYLDLYQEDPGNLSEEDFRADWQQAAVKHDVLNEQMRHVTPSLRLTQMLGDAGEFRLGFIHRQSKGTEVTQGYGQTAAAALRETEKERRESNLQLIYRHEFEPLAGKLNVGADLIRGTNSDDLYNRQDRQRQDLNTASTIRETGRSPFAQYEFSPFKRLRLTAGIRHEDFEYDVEQLSFDRQGQEVYQSGKQSYSKLVKKGGLVFMLNEDNRLWASVAEGFRVPSTNATVTATYPNPDLPPETMLTTEVGLRGQWREPNVHYDFTLYETTIEDYHLSVYCIDQPDRCSGFNAFVPGANWATYTDAVGKIRFRGFEAAAGWQPTEWLRFDGAYTRATSKLLDYINRGEDYSGNSLNAMPLHRLNARATVMPIAGSYIELEADYISSYYTSLDNQDRYNRPTLYHLRTGYQHKNWRFTVQLLNLLDSKYSPRVSQSGGERIFNAGYGPRTLRAGLIYRW